MPHFRIIKTLEYDCLFDSNDRSNIVVSIISKCTYVSNMLCEFNINMSDIINGSASNLMKIAYTGFNALPDEL